MPVFADADGAESEATRLVLCMIVRNEAAILRRCLESALPYVDGYVICDTGSSDDTVRIIEETSSRHGVSGRVARHAWRDFGHNRTLSALEARNWVLEAGWPADRTYLLFLDADMVLRVDPTFDRQSLTATYYDLVQDNGTLRFANTRLACLSHEWISIGATHEYWQPRGEKATSSAGLETMEISDVGDGGGKDEKYSRDIRLLRQELAREPDNPRHTFYLAQSFHDIGRWSEAAHWYHRRWKLGGWDQERWFARYREGLCLLRMGDALRGAGVLLDAFDERPSRAEPLWALARHYREHSRNNTALMFALRGLELSYPADDVLFVEKQVYEWQLWEEVMISAYYAGAASHELGLSACERLLARRGHEPGFYAYVANNEVFYLPQVAAARRGAFTVPSELLTHDGVEYRATNPTIARCGREIHVNIRILNYRQERGLHYTSQSPDGVFRTLNANLSWDPDTGSAGPLRLTRDIPAHWSTATWGRGLEDVRWLRHRGSVWFTAVCYQVPGAEGTCRVVLGRLDKELREVEHLVGLHYAEAKEIEKNWLLWPAGDEMRVIYSYDPFLVLRVDAETGDTEPALASEPVFRAADFRGSCVPVPFPDGTGRWLALVHQVATRPSGRVYSHRWIGLDQRAGLVSCSRPFVFDHVGIEYATGLCDLDGERLVVTYGHDDCDARWLECRWDTVRAMLRASEADFAPLRKAHGRRDA